MCLKKSQVAEKWGAIKLRSERVIIYLRKLGKRLFDGKKENNSDLSCCHGSHLDAWSGYPSLNAFLPRGNACFTRTCELIGTKCLEFE